MNGLDRNRLSCGLPPPTSHASKLSDVVSLSQSSCVSPVELSNGRGGERGVRGANHTTTRQPDLLKITQYSLVQLD
jgi:hypothetical protein